MYQQAKRLFLDGKVDEAIELLDDEKIRQEKNEGEKKAAENAVQAWLFKARLLSTKFREVEAGNALSAALDAASKAGVDRSETFDTLRQLIDVSNLYARTVIDNLEVLHTDPDRHGQELEELEEGLKISSKSFERMPFPSEVALATTLMDCSRYLVSMTNTC